MKHTFDIVIGDRWDDGHGKYEKFTVDSTLHQSVVGTVLREDFPWLGDLCREYEDSSVPENMVKNIKDAGLDPEKYANPYRGKLWVEGTVAFVTLQLDLVATKREDFKYELKENLPELELGGYGLFH